MEAETKEKGTFQPLQGHFLPWNPIYVPNSLIRHAITDLYYPMGKKGFTKKENARMKERFTIFRY